MQRISSNATLFLKIFVPTFWFVFFGLLTGFIIFSDPETSPFFRDMSSKLILLLSFIIFAFLIYFTLIQLKRLDLSDEGLFVSNYLKTYRYDYVDIAEIKEQDYLLFHVLKIKMKKKTSLGKSFSILLNKAFWKNYLIEHPEFFAHLKKT